MTKQSEIDRFIANITRCMPGIDWTERINLDIKGIVASKPIKAILLASPGNDEIDLFEKFVVEILAKHGITHIVLRVGYHFEFLSHPEVVEQPALSQANAGRIARICRDNDIILVPKMNLFGHQSDTKKVPFGIIRAYPDMEEITGEDIAYCRCLCLSHPDLKPLVYDLMDEMLQVFGSDHFHIGQDEAFEIGKCPRCVGKPNEVIYADWLNSLHDHLAEKHVKTWLWGDRLLNGTIMPERGIGYETSLVDTWKAVSRVPRDFMICDWHYRVLPYGHMSPAYWDKHGFDFIVCPFNNMCAADQLIVAAQAADSVHFQGVFDTTWSRFATFVQAVYDLYPQYLVDHEIDEYAYEPGQEPPCYNEACVFLHLFVR